MWFNYLENGTKIGIGRLTWRANSRLFKTVMNGEMKARWKMSRNKTYNKHRLIRKIGTKVMSCLTEKNGKTWFWQLRN